MNKSKLKLTETRYIHKPDKFYKEPFPMEPRMAETQEIKGDVAGHLVDISRTRGITVGQNDPYLYIGSVDDRKIDVYLAKRLFRKYYPVAKHQSAEYINTEETEIKKEQQTKKDYEILDKEKSRYYKELYDEQRMKSVKARKEEEENEREERNKEEEEKRKNSDDGLKILKRIFCKN